MEHAELESLLEIADPSAEAWCSVFLRLKMNRDKIQTPETTEIVCNALHKKVEDIGCKDKDSIWKIISIYFINLWKDAFDFQIPDSFQIPNNFHLSLLERGVCSLEEGFDQSLLVSFQQSTFTISRIGTDHPADHHTFRISSLLRYSLRKAEVKVLYLLLKYGYLHPISVYDAVDEIIHATSSICNRAPKLSGHACTRECSEKLDKRLKLLFANRFTEVHGCENLRVYQRGFKRILLAQICIPVLGLPVGYRSFRTVPETGGLQDISEDWNTNNPEQYVQCLRLYFRGVADPFVEADEYEELLRFFLFCVREDYIHGLVQDFKRLYPESRGPYRPRSLKHLCRCAIRQKLTHRPKVLPVLLNDLGLPSSLKMYIMGDL